MSAVTKTNSMPDTSSPPKHWRNALVLLLAHGAQSTPQGSIFVRQQAEAVRKLGLFADVQATFLRDSPHPRDLIANAPCQDIYVVPFMVAEGYSIEVMIPEILSLRGQLTEVTTVKGRRRVHLCRAIGTHRAVRDRSIETVKSIISGYGISPDDVAVLVLCHGTARHMGGRKHAAQAVRSLENSGLCAQTAKLFLEEEPKISDWRQNVSSRYVIALPYLMTAGRHGAKDIPDLLGIDAGDTLFQDAVVNGTMAGPFDVAGRKLWYAPLLGALDEIPEIIVDRVYDWDKTVT